MVMTSKENERKPVPGTSQHEANGHRKNQKVLVFSIIRTFEKFEPLTNIPLCRKNCILKGSDFIWGVLCFVKKTKEDHQIWLMKKDTFNNNALSGHQHG